MNRGSFFYTLNLKGTIVKAVDRSTFTSVIDKNEPLVGSNVWLKNIKFLPSKYTNGVSFATIRVLNYYRGEGSRHRLCILVYCRF